MTQQFHEGQDVVVYELIELEGDGTWRKAKIVGRDLIDLDPEAYILQFPDGSRAVFDSEHIRAVAMTSRDDNGRTVRGW